MPKIKNESFEFKLQSYQSIYNSTADETIKGECLQRIADIVTCAEFRSLIRMKHNDNKGEQAKIIIKLFAQYINYRNCLKSLETARNYAYDVDFDSKGRPKKAIMYTDLERIIKESIKKSSNRRDNDDSMEIFMSVCCELQKCVNMNNGKLDLFSEYHFKDLQTKVLKKGETTKIVDRCETYLNRCFRSARQAVDNRSSVKAVVNGYTYMPAYDTETEREYYIRYGKYADVSFLGIDSENAEESEFLDSLELTKAQRRIADIILEHNGNIDMRSIADICGYSDVSTIRDHFKAIRKKLMKSDKVKVSTSAVDRWINVFFDSIVRKSEKDDSVGMVSKRKAKKGKAVTIPHDNFGAYDFVYEKCGYASVITLENRYSEALENDHMNHVSRINKNAVILITETASGDIIETLYNDMVENDSTYYPPIVIER